jgi:hypothetical protein
MNVTSLETMEDLVANNNSLDWDGWTVVSRQKNDAAWMKPNGVFVKGKWYNQTRYEPTEAGWTIPSKLVG